MSGSLALAVAVLHLGAPAARSEPATDAEAIVAALAGMPQRAEAERLLSASLEQTQTRPPLGRLGSQVYTLGGRAAWDDDAELIFGLDYALEAIALRDGL